MTEALRPSHLVLANRLTRGVWQFDGCFGARARVFRNVDPWTVVGGNPARVLRKYGPEQEDI